MKTRRKILSMLLSCALIIAGLYQNDSMAKAANAAKISAETVTVQPGEDISIPVNISGNQGIMGFKMSVTYDKEILTPTSVEAGELIPSGTTFLSNEDISTSNYFDVLWAGVDEINTDGVIYTLHFTVADSAVAGITEIELTYSQADTFNEAYEDVTLDCQNISVAVEGGTGVTSSPIVNTPTVSPTSGTENTPTISPTAPTDSEQPSSSPSSSPDATVLPEVTPVPTDQDFTVYADAVSAKAGEEVVIPICMANNQGIMGFKFHLTYDADVLTPVSVETGTLIPANTIFESNEDISTTNSFDVLWAGIDDISGDGCLFNLTFQVAEDATAGRTSVQIGYSQPDTFNVDYEDVVLNCNPVTVVLEGGSGTVSPTPSTSPTTSPSGSPTSNPTSVPTQTPVETQEPEISAMPDFNSYIGYADVNWKESFFFDDTHSVKVTGDGNYTVSFVAGKDAEDILVLSLDIPFEPSELPEGFVIRATKLIVGETEYELGECDYTMHEDGTYRVSLRNPYDTSVENNALGDQIIPVSKGETVSIKFEVEGTGKQADPNATTSPSTEPTQSPSTEPTQSPAVDPTQSPSMEPTQSPAVEPTQSPSTEPTQSPTVDTTQNPSGSSQPSNSPTLGTQTTGSSTNGGGSDSKEGPKKVLIKKVKSTGKKKLKVTWKWDAYSDGYQIQYATNKKFKNKRTLNASTYASAKTISKLKSKKKYYVRVRGYIYDNGTKKYGKWSKVKACKVK